MSSKDERLPPTRRVRKRQDFLRLQSGRRKIRTHHLLLAMGQPRTIESSASGEAEESRLGVTVTKKVDKRAARRNRFKRRVREFFRKERRYFLQTVDLVVIALEGAAELDYKQLAYELRWGLRKAGVLKTRLKPSGRAADMNS